MTVPTAGEQTCPRCGASTGGAPWCPACGLNLRLHTPETPAAEITATPSPPLSPPPPLAAPPPARSERSRRRAVALIAGVLVLGGAIATVAVLAFRSSSPRSRDAAKTVVKTVAVTDVVTGGDASTLPPVTVDEMHNELNAYARAYSDESVGELASLFAPDLRRRNDHDPVEDLAGALGTYRQQFAQLRNPNYQLTDLRYQPGQGSGTAEGRYVITSSAGESTGGIAFEFVARGGFLYIDKIAIAPA